MHKPLSRFLASHQLSRLRIGFAWLIAATLTWASPVIAQTCPFDNGGSTLANDGLVMTRYALGLRGTDLVANTAFAAADAPTIESNINCPACGLNVTGQVDGASNPTFTVADATIISRKIAGFSGTQLTNGVALGSGARSTPTAVQSFLLAGCGAGALPSCLSGQVLTFAANGTLQCGNTAPARSVLTNRQTGLAVPGYDLSMVLPADGLPVIAFHNANSNRLNVMKCRDSACASDSTVTVVDAATNTSANVGIGIAVPADGLPVISYYDNLNQNLRVLKCGTAACTLGNTSFAIDTPGFVGKYSSIAVPTDGLPVISYFDETLGQLKVAKCGNALCSTTQSVTTVDTTGTNSAPVGFYTSIAVPAGGTPVIGYLTANPYRMKVVKCGNAGCTAGNVITTVDPGVGAIGFNTVSLSIPSDGFPVMSYSFQIGSAQTLNVAKCGNAACSSGNTVTAVDGGGPAVLYIGLYSSLVVPADGRPVISYYDGTENDLKVMRCGNASCSSGNISSVVDGTGIAGLFTSMVLPADGRPLIAYVDNAGPTMKIVKCSNAGCLSP